MKFLLKPRKLELGDKIATISLSWGIAGDENCLWRYEQGKARLKDEFGLEVVETPNSLKGSDFLERNPELRAKDLMWAFSNPEIKAIIANIGGNDSIRILQYLDLEIIKNNPKIFIGYSDVTWIHLICYKAGITSFYGPNLLTDIAENGRLNNYTKHWFNKCLFDNTVIGEIFQSNDWTNEVDDLFDNKKNRSGRQMLKNDGVEILQGSGKVKGHLIGGSADIIVYSSKTLADIPIETWDNAIMFIEDIIECVPPEKIMDLFRWYGTTGILQRINGIIIGKFNCYPDKKLYKDNILKVVNDELGLSELPILYNLNFGHTYPSFLLPYGVFAEIDCDNKKLYVLESAVI